MRRELRHLDGFICVSLDPYARLIRVKSKVLYLGLAVAVSCPETAELRWSPDSLRCSWKHNRACATGENPSLSGRNRYRRCVETRQTGLEIIGCGIDESPSARRTGQARISLISFLATCNLQLLALTKLTPLSCCCDTPNALCSFRKLSYPPHELALTCNTRHESTQ